MKAIGPLVGYVMQETKGRADGGEVTRLIREKLGLGRVRHWSGEFCARSHDTISV